MLGVGVYQRWQLARKSDRMLEIAHVQAALMGMRVDGTRGPFCAELVFRFPTCDCCSPAPGRCGNLMTRARFIWHGRCVECSIKQKELTKRRR